MTYQEHLAALIADITPHLKADLDAQRYAVALIEANDEDDGHYEVSARDTATGVPYTTRLNPIEPRP